MAGSCSWKRERACSANIAEASNRAESPLCALDAGGDAARRPHRPCLAWVDALGRAGLAGAVDSFFWARFGGALLLSLVDDAAYIAGQAASSGNGNFNNVTRAPEEAAIALQNNINIRPVLKKNQGEEVGIFVAKDFNFADVYNLELRR
jgi:hypothetical protein